MKNLQSSALLISLSLAIPALALKRGNSIGGNHVTNKYRLTGDKFGDNNQINMQSQTQQQGGGVSRRGVLLDGEWALESRDPDASSTISFSATRFGKNNKIEVRDAEADDEFFDFDTRDAHDELDLYVDQLYRRLAKGKGGKAFSGGSGEGGSGDGRGGNAMMNAQNFKKANFGPGTTLNSLAQIQQSGGNAKGGVGGANKGNGGAGGDVSIPVPIPMARRDAIEYEDMLYARNAFAEPEPKKAGGGGSGGGGRAFSGGDAKGGSADGKAGNQAGNVQNFKKANFGSGSVLNTGASISQSGGNAFGGKGGANFGDGGKGGGLALNFSPMHRRALEYMQAMYSRDAEAEPEAEADELIYEREAAFEDPEAEIWAREAEWYENFE